MRYLNLLIEVIVVPFTVIIFTSNSFAQSSEAEALKAKVEMLEKEMEEIKDLLKQQIEKDVQKEKEIVSLKEEVQKKEVKIAAEAPPQPAPVKETTVAKEEGGEMPYLAKPGAE